MGKMATRVMFLTDDAAPGSVWAAGNLTGGEREPGGIEGVDGVIDAPGAIAVPAAAVAATHVTEQGVEATVDEEEVQPGGAGDDHLPGPDTGGPADSPHYGLLGHRQEADGHEHRQAQAPFLPGRRKEVTFREELEEYPRRFLKNARGFIAHQTPTAVYAAIYDDELRGKAYVRFKYEDIKSIELRRGLVYHVYNAVVEMSSALPVEDRLVIFDAWRLPEPLECDHHCVRYMGINVRICHAFCSYKELMNEGE